MAATEDPVKDSEMQPEDPVAHVSDKELQLPQLDTTAGAAAAAQKEPKPEPSADMHFNRISKRPGKRTKGSTTSPVGTPRASSGGRRNQPAAHDVAPSVPESSPNQEPAAPPVVTGAAHDDSPKRPIIVADRATGDSPFFDPLCNPTATLEDVENHTAPVLPPDSTLLPSVLPADAMPGPSGGTPAGAGACTSLLVKNRIQPIEHVR